MAEHPDPSTRQRLIDATLAVIDELGIEAVKVVDIAERANVTTGAIYWFFKNREALINAALAEQYVMHMRSLLDSMQNSIDFLTTYRVDPLEPSRVLARQRQIQVLAGALQNQELAIEVASIQRDFLERATRFVEGVKRTQTSPSDIDPYCAALYVQAMFVGFALVDLAPDLVPDPQKWRRVNEVVLKALLGE